MDAYLSKPLQAQQLFETIANLVASSAYTPEAERAADTDGVVFDQHAALARVQGDNELLQDIVGLFFEEAPTLLLALREAMARGDCQALTRAAHSLKGTVSSFGAPAAREAALRLETMGRSGDLTYAAPACAELEREIASLAGALAVFREGQERCKS